MTINDCCNFVYANQSSSELGVWRVDINLIDESSNDEEAEIIQTTTPFIDKWHFHGIQKSNPLTFKLTICKSNGGYIDAFTEEILKEWLCQGEFNWLQFEQDDLINTFYNCIMINPQKINAGRRTIGMQFTVICDSGHAWSNLKSEQYTSNGTYSFDFYNDAKYHKYELCPILTFVPAVDGNISITNVTTNKTITINNCVTPETIILDCENEMAESSNGRILVNDWNLEFISMIQGINNITLTGNFTLQIDYRMPVRVGG